MSERDVIDGYVVEPVVDEQVVEEVEQPQETGTINVPIELVQLVKAAPSGQDILDLCIDIAGFLCSKNISYGNSAITPINIFSKYPAKDQILTRIDDKINRVKNGGAYPGDDDMRDLLGYFVLYHVALVNEGRNMPTDSGNVE